MAFPGFSPLAVDWLQGLVANNNREWFNANKVTYENEVKQPFLRLVESLNHHLASKLPEYYMDDPSRAPFRIYRDTRFSKNKTPYKNHIAAAFPRRGIQDKAAGLYVQISATGVGIAGGSYLPDPDSLRAIRHRIADDFDAFQKLMANKRLKKLMGEMQGDVLTRVPKGFLPDHPAADWLRRKQFYCWTELDPTLITSPKLEKEVLAHFEVLGPICLYIDNTILDARKAGARRTQFLR